MIYICKYGGEGGYEAFISMQRDEEFPTKSQIWLFHYTANIYSEITVETGHM